VKIEDERSFSQVLLQSKVEVADLEFLGELKGDARVVFAQILGGAR